MKKLLFVFIFLLPMLVFGQEVGEYYLSRGFGFPRYISILENSRFEGKSFSCKSVEQGSGFYTIKNRILTLNYITDSTKVCLTRNETSTTLPRTDSVNIKIKVRGCTEKDTLMAATIVFKNKKPVEGMISDLDGNIEFSLPKSQDTCTFTLSMIGFESTTYSLLLDKNGCITNPQKQKDYKLKTNLGCIRFGYAACA